MDEARSHPKLRTYFNDNAEAKTALDEALGNDFDVCVVATMSAGKSTLINAMLGRDLLPAANEATTATIARIVHNGELRDRFNAARITRDGERAETVQDAELELIQQWNRMEDTATIEARGAISAVRDRDNVRLVLTDTPGRTTARMRIMSASPWVSFRTRCAIR
ncbi:dynamin family protein [Achromobacter insuavis]